MSQMHRSKRFPRLALGSSFPLSPYRGVGKGNHAHTGDAHMRVYSFTAYSLNF